MEEKFTFKECEDFKPARRSVFDRLVLFMLSIVSKIQCRFQKSNLERWAEREVNLACFNENPTRKREFDYECCCYESALKAFKSLCRDGHSGYSIKATQRILNRLIDVKPLTPIEDTPDVWSDIITQHSDRICYQNKRMSSLFKDVYFDGETRYRDVNRYYCVDVNDQNITYTTGLVSEIIDEIFPIKMPYYPGNPIKVYCEEFLTDPKNGDFDTRGVLYALKPDGERIEINRFFRDSNQETSDNKILETYPGWIEITKNEYEARKASKIERR